MIERQYGETLAKRVWLAATESIPEQSPVGKPSGLRAKGRYSALISQPIGLSL